MLCYIILCYVILCYVYTIYAQNGICIKGLNIYIHNSLKKY